MISEGTWRYRNPNISIRFDLRINICLKQKTIMVRNGPSLKETSSVNLRHSLSATENIR